jgi:hypothetical protein
LKVEIVKAGESPAQGVGYLPDGTMVVVEDGSDHIGQSVPLIVTNSLQTSAGRMIFGRLLLDEEDDGTRLIEQMAESATSQPRATGRPASRRDSPPSPRTPRR